VQCVRSRQRRFRLFQIGALALTIWSSGGVAQSPAVSDSTVSVPEVSDAVRRETEAESLSRASVSPDRKWLLLLRQQGIPGLDLVAAPKLVLAGREIDPRANSALSTADAMGTGYTLIRLRDQKAWNVVAPQAGLSGPLWSPGSTEFVFRHRTPNGVELWKGDVDSKTTRALTGPVLNGARSDGGVYPPCFWMPDGARLLCQVIPKGRGAVPELTTALRSPAIEETGNTEQAVAGYGPHLSSNYDDELYDYYMTSQAVLIDAATGSQLDVGRPAIYETLSVSPDGRFLLATRIVRPYSHQYDDERFPKQVEVLDLAGHELRVLASIPTTPWGRHNLGWAPPGARRFAWLPSAPATVTYLDCLDGGDPQKKSRYRDRVLMLPFPFQGKPIEILRTEGRLPAYYPDIRYLPIFGNVAWLEHGGAWVEEYDFATQRKRIWLADTSGSGRAPRVLKDWFSMEDAYTNPGSALMTAGPGGFSTYRGADEAVLRQDGDWVYLVGDGGSPGGDRPFLDRFNVRSLATERLFRSRDHSYEQVVNVLDSRGQTVLTRYEDLTTPPNYYLRDLKRGSRTPLTHAAENIADLRDIRIQKIDYQRNDGLQLSAQLYLPAGYRPGTAIPTIVWVYPWAYVDASAAAQVHGSPYHYPWTDGLPYSRIARLMTAQGYAVLWDTSMPLVGGPNANDTAVTQIVASARAAVDKLVNMGVAAPDEISVAGHSYGALTVGVLLANSDMFAAGIALDGAYNLTNSPLGFQQELRTLWQAPAAYDQLSALMHADRIQAPLLLIHGELDNNWIAKPQESRLLYHALSGLGRRARLVMLPYEGHAPEARESLYVLSSEMLSWMNRYGKQRPKPAAQSAASEEK
jgi:dipeptidyl aminopeptidase/acylaminoacyl peptidase